MHLNVFNKKQPFCSTSLSKRKTRKHFKVTAKSCQCQQLWPCATSLLVNVLSWYKLSTGDCSTLNLLSNWFCNINTGYSILFGWVPWKKTCIYTPRHRFFRFQIKTKIFGRLHNFSMLQNHHGYVFLHYFNRIQMTVVCKYEIAVFANRLSLLGKLLIDDVASAVQTCPDESEKKSIKKPAYSQIVIR